MAASMQHERVQDFILGENASSLGDISQGVSLVFCMDGNLKHAFMSQRDNPWCLSKSV